MLLKHFITQQMNKYNS